MKEELYIINEGSRDMLDLYSKSGITLSFDSNLFNAIDKVSCCHSYTIKIPKTKTNCQIFDNADLVQVHSGIPYKVLKAEYVLNGLAIFSNANIYIESCDSCFNAVLTWDFIEGLKAISEDKKKISEIALNTGLDATPEATYLSGDNKMVNTADYLLPQYDCGIDRSIFVGQWNEYFLDDACYPLPVVPVVKILKDMERVYGVNFDFYTEVDEYITDEETAIEVFDNHPKKNYNIDFGVIPCVTTEISDAISKDYRFVLSGINKCYLSDTRAWFGTIQRSATQTFFTVRVSTGSNSDYGITPLSRMGIRASGIIYATFEASQESPSMKFVQFNSIGEKKEVGSVEGVMQANSTRSYVFDFREEYLCDVELGDLKKGEKIYIEFPAKITSVTSGNVAFYPYFTDGDGVHQMSANYALPDITCMDLLKHLFYMQGGFPKVKDNAISIASYADIKTNLSSGNVYDWSNKVISFDDVEVRYKVGDFVRKNSYKMASDKEASGIQQFVYKPGACTIESDVIDSSSKDIFQSVFNAQYIQNRKTSTGTGNTFKYWTREKQNNKSSYSAEKAEPCYGIMDCEQTYDRTSGQYLDSYYTTMSVWNGFDNVTQNEGYQYLQTLIRKPIVIKIKMRLDEFDLYGIDYAKPVFIEKYNAYFVIIKIELSDGVSKVELLKIPQ